MKYLWISLAVIAFGFLVSILAGMIIFLCSIDNTYSQYNLVSQGKLDRYVDCIGDVTIDIGQYSVPNDITIYAKGHQEGGLRPLLKGGDCEYSLYKGWYWGVWDFYYITPK